MAGFNVHLSLLERHPQADPRPTQGVIHALYLHTPFCFHKCHYCDFYSIVEDDPARQQAFVDRLIAELTWRDQQQAPLRPRTLFVGGGTPTYLPDDAWARLLDAMHRQNLLQNAAEFTCEANPETVRPDQVRLLAAGGVNRISIGAQSFQPGLLKTLERWHDPASVPRAVDICRQEGVTNLNLDLIFAIPGQTPAMLEDDLDRVLALEPEHISAYNLTFEPQTAMTRRMELGQIAPVDEDTAAVMYRRVIDRLGEAGYEHYEISNWARPGRQCQHNLAYWHNENWLGLGPAAASHVAGVRWKNKPHLGHYLDSTQLPPIQDIEHLPDDQARGETLMMRLRLLEGAPREMFDPARLDRAKAFIDMGLLEEREQHIRLTPRGLMVADSLFTQFL